MKWKWFRRRLTGRRISIYNRGWIDGYTCCVRLTGECGKAILKKIIEENEKK